MEVLKDYSLKSHNTFGIDAKCDFLIKVNSEATLHQALKSYSAPYFILGGGSNLLLSKDQELTVLKNEILGKEIIEESEDKVLVRVGGGENWHEFVLWAINEGFGGIENLSLIPGTVGASPIQNIGAYGVELEQVFHSLEAISISDGSKKVFNKKDCAFGYRNSVFKTDLKGKYFITRVTFNLSKKNHKVNTEYGAISSELERRGIANPSIRDVSDAVISIRKSKLPDPQVIGNSGSFFKNPIVPIPLFEEIKNSHPNVPHYPISNTEVKLPAGWLIEQAGWKGRRIGDAGSYEKQALVLVNHGNAKGEDILDLAKCIIADVYNKFNVMLSPEVNVI